MRNSSDSPSQSCSGCVSSKSSAAVWIDSDHRTTASWDAHGHQRQSNDQSYEKSHNIYPIVLFSHAANLPHLC
ncbi:hypothetical protein COCNU_16G003030 [Cocos nucifera]|uniref:Uncharacterized protein n=1 Tax=Cocos nucifera TaxID=13894 RepID=A0A8K0NFC6_COCNU|nr:hypothetical protein COCNU_16G003030 [Cocos nucifera]